MPVVDQERSVVTPAKREFFLEKRDGAVIGCKIPPEYTVGQAKHVLAERAGYDPELAGTPTNVRLAVKSEEGYRLVTDETTFRSLEEGTTFKPIPSLAPARS